MFWRRRKSRDEEIDRELRSHIGAEADEQEERGVGSEEARYAAMRALGNASSIKEQLREISGRIWLERLQQDIIYAARSFARTPAFTIVVVLTLGLGIGATTAMFSIVDAVFLHPLPYRNPDRLVVIWEKLAKNPDSPPVFDSYRDFQIWKKTSRSFEQLAPATWATGGQILTGSGHAQDVLAMPVGISFFPLLGVAPEIGRTFQQDDLHRGCMVVLKHGFWITTFAASKGVIGRHIELNERACTVIGVMPPGFTFYPEALSMWTLITPESEIARDPENASVGVFGLLKPGVSRNQAQKELQLIFSNEHRKELGIIPRAPYVYPLAEQFAYLSGPNLRLTVIVLFAAVTFVLLIACVNIANLLLGRSLVRQKELAVRAALGSGRARLIRQLLTEGLLLSFAGALFGILLATGAVHGFRALNPIEMPPGNPVSVNLPVLAFTAALAVLTAFLFGLIPALKASRVDLADALRASGHSASFGRGTRALAKMLVAAEVMLSLALLAGAGLLIKSVNHLASVPLGFRTDHIISVLLELPKWSYTNDSRRTRFYNEALERASALPGVDSVAFASSLPLNNARWGGKSLALEGRPEPTAATATRDVSQASVSAGYFRVMGIPLRQGRLFDSRDRKDSPATAIVNNALALKYFPHENPIGKHVKVGEPGTERPWLTIVGVTADEKDKEFFHEMNWQDIPTVFRPVTQDPPQTGSLVLRTANNSIVPAAGIQDRISSLDSSVPVGEVHTLNERLARTLAYPRFRAVILGTFAGMALLLAGVGLYGVLSQFTMQRTQEFGVRIALGAQELDVLALVMRQGILLTAAGLAAGLAVALCLTKFLSSLLSGVNVTDPWTFAAVSLLLLFVALFAIYIPARKAARVDPMVALRNE